MRSHEKLIMAAGDGRAGKCRHGGDPGARGRHAAPGEQAGALMDKLNIVEGRAYPFGMKNVDTDIVIPAHRSEEHTSELQSLMRISYAVFCLKKKTTTFIPNQHTNTSQKKSQASQNLPTLTNTH